MAALRALLMLLAILGFFLVGAPLQVLVARWAPRRAEVIPRLFCRSLLWLAKVRVTTRGAPASGSVLVVANHVSWIDVLALRAAASVCFLAKDEIARWPIISTFAAVQGTVFVDRRRRRSIIPANAAMAARMAEGRPVLLFPEGTTTAGPEPGPFRSSHLAAVRDVLALRDRCAVIASAAKQPSGRESNSGTAATCRPLVASRLARNDETGDDDESGRLAVVAVQPAAIAYSSAAAAWIGDDALLPHLWRILRGPPLVCTVCFGTPLSCTAASDRKVLARVAHGAVVGLLAAIPAAREEKVATAPSGDFDLAVQPTAGGA